MKELLVSRASATPFGEEHAQQGQYPITDETMPTGPARPVSTEDGSGHTVVGGPHIAPAPVESTGAAYGIRADVRHPGEPPQLSYGEGFVVAAGQQGQRLYPPVNVSMEGPYASGLRPRSSKGPVAEAPPAHRSQRLGGDTAPVRPNVNADPRVAEPLGRSSARRI
jgi:hypothetical protein